MALLAGMVRGPSYYDPRRHPERAKRRRNHVTRSARGAEHRGSRAAERARSEPLGVTDRPPPASTRFRRSSTWFAGSFGAITRAGCCAARGSGSSRPSIPPSSARRNRRSKHRCRSSCAGAASRAGNSRPRSRPRMPDPAKCSRSWRARPAPHRVQSCARCSRPVGSLVKPAVYLAALTEPQFHLASFVRDDPVQVNGPRGPWRPQNHDGRTHGTVFLHDALVHSYNLATVRLGLDVGLERVRTRSVRSGCQDRSRRIRPASRPVELAPIEVNAMYQSLATGGLRQPPASYPRRHRPAWPLAWALPRALDAGRGQRRGVPRHPRVRGVLSEGTGRRARDILGRGQVLAGKTGTTDGPAR